MKGQWPRAIQEGQANRIAIMPDDIVQNAEELIVETADMAYFWLGPLILLAVAILFGAIAHRILWRILARMLRRSDWWRQALKRARNPARLAFAVLAISLALPVAGLPEEIRSAIAHLLTVAMIALLGWTGILLTNLFTDRLMRGHRLDTEDNLHARKLVTQVRVLRRSVNIVIFLVATACVLLTFDSVRKYGVSLFASAGVAGLAVGFAARPVLANLIAGIQIALTQPIRLEDVVIVEGEWGWIEEISTTYVVVRIWDWRRLVVPLSYFIEKPFENWTREGTSIIGAVTWHVDYTVPVETLRAKLIELIESSSYWDGQVAKMHMVDATDKTVVIRGIMSAKHSIATWELRCEIREKLIVWLQQEYPQALPRFRAEFTGIDGKPEEAPA